MVEVIIYTDPREEPKEAARVTIEGKVIGDTPTAESIRDRMQDERDPIINNYSDGRELLRYLASSYSNGYIVAGYDSEESLRIIEDMSDEGYQRWAKESEFDTEL
jgi:hypothetical protein